MGKIIIFFILLIAGSLFVINQYQNSLKSNPNSVSADLSAKNKNDYFNDLLKDDNKIISSTTSQEENDLSEDKMDVTDEQETPTKPIIDSEQITKNEQITIPGSEQSVEPLPEPEPQTALQWGAFVGYDTNDITNFENLTGDKPDIISYFDAIENEFPTVLANRVGPRGQTLVIYLESSDGFDSIISGNYDNQISQYVLGAKNYGYPIILVPFAEMNINEEAWGYGQNNNTAKKFQIAWRHIHDLFNEVNNVKFGIAYNNISIPNKDGNQFIDYYPGDAYVDYVGVDGFNFANPWQTFDQIFGQSIASLSQFSKPIYIFSMASAEGPQKSQWISEGLGKDINKYKNIVGWIWFNSNKEKNWLINSDNSSLEAFKSILP